MRVQRVEGTTVAASADDPKTARPCGKGEIGGGDAFGGGRRGVARRSAGVETLRREGFDESVVLVAEPTPYDRPPLSSSCSPVRSMPTVWRCRTGYDDLDVDLELGVRAVGLDLDAREVAIDSGDGAACDRWVSTDS